MKKTLRIFLIVATLLISGLLLGACGGPVTGDRSNPGPGEKVAVQGRGWNVPGAHTAPGFD